MEVEVEVEVVMGEMLVCVMIGDTWAVVVGGMVAG